MPGKKLPPSQPPPPGKPGAGALSRGGPVLCFLFFFLFLLLFINPQIIYTSNGTSLRPYVRFAHLQATAPEMIRKAGSFNYPELILEATPSSFKQEALSPGGATRVLAALVVTACYYPVAGALLITAIAWLLFFLVPLFSRQCGGASLPVVRYVLPLWLLVSCAWYELNALFWVIPVLGAFAAAIAFQRLRPAEPPLLWITATALFWALWYLFGPSCLLFLALICVHAVLNPPRQPAFAGSAAAVNATVLYFVESRIVPPENAMNAGFLLEPPLPPVIAVAAVLLIVIMLHPALSQAAVRGRANKVASRKAPGWLGAVLLLFLIAATTGWTLVDPVNRDTRTVARTLHFLLHRQWDRILKEDYSALYKNFPSEAGALQTFASHAVCRALYEKGQLGSALFSHPLAQFSPEPLLLLRSTLVHGFTNWIAAIDLYTDLGLANLAEKVTGETMECMGPYPFLVHRRALLQAAKGNVEAASVYAWKLKGMPPYGKKARKILGMLNDSAVLAADGTVAHLRACMDTCSYFLFSSREETMLQSMLKSNPGNRMAFEYLMAFYLLTGQPEKVAGGIDQAAALGYASLPRHWEEALCITMSRDSAWAARAAEMPVRPETMEMFDRFMQRYSQYENDPVAAPRELEKEFGTSYFYFYTFEFTRGAQR